MTHLSVPGLVSGWFRTFFVAPLARAEQDARANLASVVGPDRKVLTLLVYTAVALTIQNYLCRPSAVDHTLGLFRAWGLNVRFPYAPGELPAQIWWALGCFVLYFVVPALFIRLVFRERLADYGFKVQGAFTDGWVYLVMLVVMGPLVLVMSANPQFQRTYPFYHPPSGRLGADFWLWEASYALQFVGLEFFFRGLLIHGLKHRFGPYCIPVMTVPYCMIHFGKPMPEALASIVAGLALGFMSLKTRSIALGAGIHIAVALSMDMASLWRTGFFAP